MNGNNAMAYVTTTYLQDLSKMVSTLVVSPQATFTQPPRLLGIRRVID